MKVLTFPPYRLDFVGGLLWRGEEPVPLRPKTFALLRLLASRPGELVTKEELLDSIWPDVSVSDVVVKVCVRELRRALKDDPKHPKFIETCHRRGYRFLASPEPPAPGSPALPRTVGREPEKRRIRELLGGKRLVSLTGPGGSGKTTLALLALGAARPAFDETFWVDLSVLTDGRLLAQVIASTLGVREQPERTLAAAICRRLATGSSLLVLDNCEHLLEAVSDFVLSALTNCSNLRVLTTSRERLGVAGETVFLVPPLALPEVEDSASADRSLKSEAIQLFAATAREGEPSFRLTDENAALVGRICRRLDGMPLAIQLAASRVKLLALEQIADRLDDCFHLLAQPGRADHPRHQTLRATMDWSYRLLSEPERLLFRRLSTLAGQWSLETAESVCPDPSLPRRTVLDLMGRLVEKSLVSVVDRDRIASYRLLETVRQYAAEKADETGESGTLRRRHVEHFVRLGESVEPRINTSERTQWLRRLEKESANLRAALQYSSEEGWWEENLRLCGALWWFWFHRGWWSEGIGWMSAALSSGVGEGRSRAKALFGNGVLAWASGALPQARAWLEESAKLWTELGDDRGLGDTLNFLGIELLSEGDIGEARRLAETSVRLLRGRENSFSLPAALASLGIVALVQEDPAAQGMLLESVRLFERNGDDWGRALPLRNLGVLHMHHEDWDQAIWYLLESLRALAPLGESWFVSRSLETLAETLALKGEGDRAARFFGAAEALRDSIGASILGFYKVDYDAAVERLRRTLAKEFLEQLWQEGRGWTREYALEKALDEAKRLE